MKAQTDGGLDAGRLGSYILVGKLGEGNMGIVYEAEHTLLGRKVALKTLRRDIASDPTLTRRILTEARAIAQLDHPGIVRLYDFGFDGGIPYLVMECVHGHTLAEMLTAGRRFEPAAAIDLLRPVAEALDHAHWNGVIHRDIKPANLLMTDDARVMITDFGLAYVLHEPSGTAPGSILGTADYIAPEQVSRDTVDARADIYSLAAVCFHCVTGRPPFIGNGWVEVAGRRLVEEPPLAHHLVPYVPRYFSHALAMGLERNPVRRPQSATELIDHLTQALHLDELKAQETQEQRAKVEQALVAPRLHAAAHRGRRGLARRAVGALLGDG